MRIPYDIDNLPLREWKIKNKQKKIYDLICFCNYLNGDGVKE